MSKRTYRLEWYQDGIESVDYFTSLLEVKLKHDVLVEEGLEPIVYVDEPAPALKSHGEVIDLAGSDLDATDE